MMKKILIFVLSILCLFSFVMASACNNDDKGDTPTSDNVVINGFNSWDDMIIFDLNPTAFIGNWEINTDKDYIVEGASSYKIYVQSTRANQPNFKMAAKGVKTDITDVEKFGLYIYNCEDYEFEVILTAFAADTVVCAPIATVKSGANNLTFDINRAIIQQSGKVVTDYSISFAGIKGDTTIYIDNLHVKTTTAPVVIKGEIQEVINGINALTNQTGRAEIEAVLDKYNALDAEDKLCVTNSARLKATIQPFWLSDLAAAQTQDPDTLLYFDMPFAEIQVDSATDGISSYSYSTEQKYGEEQGSLKVNFTTSSTNWVSLNTSATTLIEEDYIEFYVYNDSDQVKALCVGWNAPLDPVVEDWFYVIEPRVWTKIYCLSDWLTNAGGASGAFQICGLQSRTEGGACAPRDAMYFSSVIKRDDGMAIAKARKGEDANTLWFFNNDLGKKQLACDYAEIELSTDVKFDGNSTTALTFNNADNTESRVSLLNFGYQFKEGDVVALYAKADVDADYVHIRLGVYNGNYLYNGKWTLVLFPADKVKTTDWLWILAENDGGNYCPPVDANVNGTIYLSKAKVYSSEEVKNLTAVEDTFEYNIGSTTFVGEAYKFNYGTYKYDDVVYASAWDNDPYIIKDTLRIVARSDWSDNATDSVRETAVGLEMKEAVNCIGKKIYITASGLRDGVFLQVFSGRESGHFDSPSGTKVDTTADGLDVWCFDVSDENSDLKYFRLWTGHELIIPDVEYVTITDICVK